LLIQRAFSESSIRPRYSQYPAPPSQSATPISPDDAVFPVAMRIPRKPPSYQFGRDTFSRIVNSIPISQWKRHPPPDDRTRAFPLFLAAPFRVHPKTTLFNEVPSALQLAPPAIFLRIVKHLHPISRFRVHAPFKKVLGASGMTH